MRRVVTILVPVLLSATACGGSASTGEPPKTATLADVTVSGPTSTRPTIDFKAPLSFAKTQSKVVQAAPGGEDVITPSSRVTVDYVAINASDGTEYDSSWKRGEPDTFSLSDVIPGLSMGLQGAHAGDRVLIGVASKDGYDPTGNGAEIRQGDSLVLVVDVHKVANPLTEATGKPVQPPKTVPKLAYDDQGHPQKFRATQQTAKAPKKLEVYPIIKGKGDVVKSGQTITVEYVGQLYPDGAVFDESWSNSQPFRLPIGTGQVIKGWDEGLVGQRVGSRVILVVPSDLGYGESGSGATIPPNSDLIFAVDILQAY